MRGLDARSRLLGALAVSVAAAVCRSWPAALAALACGLCALSLGGGAWSALARRLALVNVFFAGIVATVPLAVPGDPLFTVWGLAYTRQGLDAALVMAVKGNAIFLVLWGLVRPLSPAALGAALSRLGVPDKLCLILSLTYRYLDLMRLEWEKLATAARMRGFTPGRSPGTWRTYGLMFALLFMRALDRSTAIHQAMICRGFTGRFVSLGGPGWGLADTALSLACLAAAAAVACLELA